MCVFRARTNKYVNYSKKYFQNLSNIQLDLEEKWNCISKF